MQIEAGRPERAAARTGGEPDFRVSGERVSGDFRCATCGYGVTVRTVLPECPMCRGAEWEAPATSPYGRARL